MKNFIFLLFCAATLIVFWGSSVFNSFTRKMQLIQKQWDNVDFQYQKRFDLTLALTEVIQNKFEHKELLHSLTESKQHYLAVQNLEDKMAQLREYDRNLLELLFNIENTQELAQDKIVVAFLDEFSSNNYRINLERVRFNDRVQDYNTKLEIMPYRLLGKWMGFSKTNHFRLENIAISRQIKEQMAQ